METTCELIKDLLPLCIEGLCGEYTKSIVKEHINKCQICRPLADSLSSPNTAVANRNEVKKAAKPFLKVKQKYRVIILTSIIIAIFTITALFTGLFLVGTTASTSRVTVQSVEMQDDGLTFSIELSSNSNVNIIRSIELVSNRTMPDFGSGHVYIKVNTILAFPFFSENSTYNVGYDRGANGSDEITAIYLMGKDPNDVKLIWQK
ncbi:MAG: hypothetical protein LBT44_08915 [Clostridiales bacterium]|jgi:predicted anti-sigma-YlaC factor YlaD|nr:hypothetical protein [Clostridiales bacterium]